MMMLKALRNRPIALLWGGQALSAIGDEIYRVALIWLAVSLIGADTGFLAAGQCAAVLTFSLIGGRWADRWDHFRTLIGVDALRALIVLLPVALYYFHPVSLPVLWGVALTLSALSAFFDPALQAMLPRFSRDWESLRAATGLMSTTIRLARVVGPAIIGLLTPWISMIHFFTLDALTFAVSALSISAIRKKGPSPAKPPARSVLDTVLSGFNLVRSTPRMPFLITVKAIAGGAWNLGYSLGLALRVHELAPHDPRAFGFVVAAYGFGNIASALFLGNLRRNRPGLMMFTGYLWLGTGFVLIAVSHGLPALMLSAAFMAIGGPMNDLPFVDVVQSLFDIDDIPKVIRLRMAVETATTLLCMLISPLLFRVLSSSVVIALCGIAIVGVGAAGLIRENRSAMA